MDVEVDQLNETIVEVVSVDKPSYELAGDFKFGNLSLKNFVSTFACV